MISVPGTILVWFDAARKELHFSNVGRTHGLYQKAATNWKAADCPQLVPRSSHIATVRETRPSLNDRLLCTADGKDKPD